jgi:hypothetical protein
MRGLFFVLSSWFEQGSNQERANRATGSVVRLLPNTWQAELDELLASPIVDVGRRSVL